MIKKIMFIFFGIILSSSFCFAAETVTITTYYPAPYGVYNVLKLFPIAAPAACTEGEMYFNSTSHNLFYCNNTLAWQSLGGGLWAINGNDIQNTNIGLVDVLTNLRLPVGTTAIGIIYAGANRFIQNLNGNTFLGIGAGNLNITAVGNIGIGDSALANSNPGGNYNAAIGASALQANISGGNNIAIGNRSLVANTTGSRNAAIGPTALGAVTTGTDNIGIGYGALSTLTNTNYNVAVGEEAGYTNTGSGNVFLGYQAGRNSGATSNRLYIDNSNTASPLIYGDFSSNLVGINTSTPQGALDVSSTTGAFLVPRMTTAQRNALTAANGMIIYNTDAVAGGRFEFRENSAWVTK